MHPPSTRRAFLADVSRATVLAAVGSSLASELGLAPVVAAEAPATPSTSVRSNPSCA